MFYLIKKKKKKSYKSRNKVETHHRLGVNKAKFMYLKKQKNIRISRNRLQ